MGRRKRPGLVRTSISIRKSQHDWLEKNHYNLSSLTRAYLDEFISVMSKAKKGIVVPAWIKMADEKTFQRRARKNPRLRYLVGKG
jgi:hypothetical protein